MPDAPLIEPSAQALAAIPVDPTTQGVIDRIGPGTEDRIQGRVNAALDTGGWVDEKPAASGWVDEPSPASAPAPIEPPGAAFARIRASLAAPDALTPQAARGLLNTARQTGVSPEAAGLLGPELKKSRDTDSLIASLRTAGSGLTSYAAQSPAHAPAISDDMASLGPLAYILSHTFFNPADVKAAPGYVGMAADAIKDLTRSAGLRETFWGTGDYSKDDDIRGAMPPLTEAGISDEEWHRRYAALNTKLSEAHKDDEPPGWLISVGKSNYDAYVSGRDIYERIIDPDKDVTEDPEWRARHDMNAPAPGEGKSPVADMFHAAARMTSLIEASTVAGPAGAFSLLYTEGRSETYQELRAQNFDHESASDIANLTGFTSAAVGAFTGERLFGQLLPKSVVQDASGAAAALIKKQIFDNPTLFKFVRDAGLNQLHAVVSNVGMAVTQAALTEVAEATKDGRPINFGLLADTAKKAAVDSVFLAPLSLYAAKVQDANRAQLYREGAPLRVVEQRYPGAIELALKSPGAMHEAALTYQRYEEQGLKLRSLQSAADLNAAAESVKNSEFIKSNAQEGKRLIRSLIDPQRTQTVFVSPEALERLPQDALASLGAGSLPDALQTGAKVGVKMEDYLASGLHDQLKDHAVLFPGGQTPKEMKEALTQEQAEELYAKQNPDEQQGLKVPLAAKGVMPDAMWTKLYGGEPEATASQRPSSEPTAEEAKSIAALLQYVKATAPGPKGGAGVEHTTPQLWRGVREGDPMQNRWNGQARFLSVHKEVADAFAAGALDTRGALARPGTVSSEKITFKNMLDTDNWGTIKSDLGLPRSASMMDVITAARGQGYDGVRVHAANNIKTTTETEYIDLRPPSARQADPAPRAPQGFAANAKSRAKWAESAVAGRPISDLDSLVDTHESLANKARAEGEKLQERTSGALARSTSKAQKGLAIATGAGEGGELATPKSPAKAADRGQAAVKEEVKAGDTAKEVRNQERLRKNNEAMAAAARKAQKEASGIQSYVNDRKSGEARRQVYQADADVGGAHDAVLEALGGKQRGAAAPDVTDAVRALREKGYPFADLGVSRDDIRTVNGLISAPRPLDSMTLPEARSVKAVLGAFDTASSAINKVRLGNLTANLDTVRGLLADHLGKLPDRAPGQRAALDAPDALTLEQKVARAANKIGDEFNQPQTLLFKMGPVGDSIFFDGLVPATAHEERLHAELGEPLKAIHESLPAHLKESGNDILSPPGSVPNWGLRTRSEVWRLALHLGTETGVSELSHNLGTSPTELLGWAQDNLGRTPAEATQIMESLVKPTWGVFDKLWDHYGKSFEERGIAPPEKLKNQSLVINGKLYEGGYGGRLKWTNLAPQEPEAGSFASLKGPGYQDPSTSQESLRERTGAAEGARPNLAWDGVASSLKAEIHDIAFDPFATQTLKILSDPAIRDLLSNKLGKSAVNQLFDPASQTSWLHTVARGHVADISTASAMTQAISKLQGAAARNAFSLNFKVMAQQLSHIPMAAVALGIDPVTMGGAVAKTWDPERRAWAHDQSQVLSLRGDDFERRNSETLTELTGHNEGDTPVHRAIAAVNYKLWGEMDGFLSHAVWEAAYAKDAATLRAGTPAPAEGTTRFYHGGADPTSGGSRWVTPHLDYASGYAAKSGSLVHYVDVPNDHPSMEDGRDEVNGYLRNFNAPEDLAKQLRPLESKSAGGDFAPLPDHARSVRAADKAVQRAMPVQSIYEQSALVRDRSAAGFFYMVRNFPNTMYNLGALNMWNARLKDANTGGSFGPARAAAQYVGMVMAAEVFGKWISGHTPAKNESDAAWTARRGFAGIAYPLMLGPVAEGLASGSVRGAASAASHMTPPSVALLGDFSTSIYKAISAKDPEAAVRAATDVLGPATNLPLRNMLDAFNFASKAPGAYDAFKQGAGYAQ